MMRVLMLFTVFSMSLPGFTQSSVNQQDEDSLSYYLNQVRTSREDAQKLEWNRQFKAYLMKTLEKDDAFTFPFDSLQSIGKLTSPDAAFRLFNWNIEKKDFTQSYFAILLVPGNRKEKVIELRDMRPAIQHAENAVCDQRKWLGCLYYDIIVSRDRGKKEYTLLGFDMNDRSSKKRIIEGLSFSGDKVVLGLPIFEVKDGDKSKTQKRIVFEYSSEVQMAMKFHAKEKRIVFDHLSPNDARAEGLYEFYFPDGSYDALELEDSGKWKYLSDVDVRGVKTRIYHDPRNN